MIGIGVVVKAVHEFPGVNNRVRGEGNLVREMNGLISLDLEGRRRWPAGVSRTVNKEKGAISGGCERNKVVGVALLRRWMVDERRREGESSPDRRRRTGRL